MSNFPCTKCGACCMNVKKLLPWYALPNGKCIHLMHDNTCAIYETRPDICRSDFIPKHIVREMFPTDNEYYRAAAEMCNKLQLYYGIDAKYRINISKI